MGLIKVSIQRSVDVARRLKTAECAKVAEALLNRYERNHEWGSGVTFHEKVRGHSLQVTIVRGEDDGLSAFFDLAGEQIPEFDIVEYAAQQD